MFARLVAINLRPSYMPLSPYVITHTVGTTISQLIFQLQRIRLRGYIISLDVSIIDTW